MASLDLNYLGQRAYKAYRYAAEGRSLVTGAPLPEWHDLSPEIRAAWIAAAAEAVDVWVKLDGQLPGGWGSRCHDPDCDGPAGHPGKHYQWVPE